MELLTTSCAMQWVLTHGHGPKFSYTIVLNTPQGKTLNVHKLSFFGLFYTCTPKCFEGLII